MPSKPLNDASARWCRTGPGFSDSGPAPVARACTRLGVRASNYFTEHIHIDEYHARDALLALRVLDAEQGADFHKAWIGVQMVRDIGRAAFRAAVDAARKGELAWKQN